MMIDTHCHLNNDDYEDLNQVIKNMKNNIMVVSGDTHKDNINVLDLCLKYPNIYGTIGIHPEEINENIDQEIAFIEKHINDNKIVGIGEIGLDYHRNIVDKTVQKEVFIKQLNLARKYKKSVVVHTRDAVEDTYEILKDYRDLKIDLHCFSGSLEMANKFTKLGFRLGIGGVVTFKNSEKLKRIVLETNLKYLLLETDSPYLTPEPFRGQRNEPYNIYYVAKKIAEIKKISIEEVLFSTTNNAISQFDLKDYL